MWHYISIHTVYGYGWTWYPQPMMHLTRLCWSNMHAHLCQEL